MSVDPSSWFDPIAGRFLQLSPLAPLLVASVFALAFAAAELWLRVRGPARAPAGPQAPRHVSIDGLRGYLALAVFVHHGLCTYYFAATGRWQLPGLAFFTQIGQVGVALFFMTTGFLFWERVLAKAGRLDWAGFFVARFFRIFPLYGAAVALVVLAVFWVSGFALRQPAGRVLLDVCAWLLFATRDINGLADTWRTIAGVTWTLRYEWLFYLGLPGVAWLVGFGAAGRALLGLLGLALMALAAYPVSIPLVGANTRYFVFFVAGALAAYAARSPAMRRAAVTRAGSTAALACLLWVLFGFETSYGLAQAALLTAVFAPIALGNTLFGLLRHRASVWLGETSYSLYLLHGLMLFYLFSIADPTWFSQRTTTLGLWGSLLALTLGLLALSRLTFRCIEQPGIRLGAWLWQRVGARPRDAHPPGGPAAGDRIRLDSRGSRP